MSQKDIADLGFGLKSRPPGFLKPWRSEIFATLSKELQRLYILVATSSTRTAIIAIIIILHFNQF